MRRTRIHTAGIFLGLGYLLLLGGNAAHAQFSGPVVPPNLPVPTQGSLGTLPSNVNSPELQKLLLLRALQQRAGSGGGVKTGVPQFIPFGNNFMPNNMLQQQTTPAAAADAPKADGKTVAEKKAEYQAAREERKRKARERAEKRKAEAAARAKEKAAAEVPADPA
jgi:hypothetical protein